MTMTFTFDDSAPGNGESPSYGAREIRLLKDALSERLTKDHMWETVGDVVDTDETGFHKKITLHEPWDASADVPANSMWVYTTDVSSLAELHVKNESEGIKIITTYDTGNSVLCLNIEAKDLRAAGSAALTDDSTLKIHTDGKLQVKDGGIDTTQLADDAVTEAKMGVPDAGAGAATIAACLIAHGTYSGDGNNNRDIVVGFTIRFLALRTTEGGVGWRAVINGVSGVVAWRANTDDGLLATDITVSGTGAAGKFTVESGGQTNQTDRTYEWVAWGDRTT